MEQTEKKTIQYYMRALHRDIGFFLVGFIIIYSLSGILLIYRDTDFMKFDTFIETKISPSIESSELGNVLYKIFYIEDFKVTKVEGEKIYFQNGIYNKTTGIVSYTFKDYPFPLNKLIKLHLSSSESWISWFTTIFGVLLFFLAISSFWMYKKNTSLFRRGTYIAGVGIGVSVLFLLL